MRAFVAMTIPEEIRQLYSKLCRPLRDVAEMSIVRPEKMHITLAFFPDLKTDDVEKVRSCITSLILEAFEIRCAALNSFRRRGRMSSIHLGTKSEKLASFADAFRKNLRKAEVYFDDKPFNAHITLARVKEIKDEASFERIYRGISHNFQESQFLSSSVSLFSSDMITYKEIFKVDFLRSENEVE